MNGADHVDDGYKRGNRHPAGYRQQGDAGARAPPNRKDLEQSLFRPW